jgi:putative toxin-antitoxin system antitoxin component (TIGR02293 family)
MSKDQVLFHLLENPTAEIEAIRKGLLPSQVEGFLKSNEFPTKETLEVLDINATTFFNRKKTRTKLNSEMSEKFLRLARVTRLALRIIGDRAEALAWLYREIPSLAKQRPMDLLDTEVGYRLVEEALLQIEHGVYG